MNSSSRQQLERHCGPDNDGPGGDGRCAVAEHAADVAVAVAVAAAAATATPDGGAPPPPSQANQPEKSGRPPSPPGAAPEADLAAGGVGAVAGAAAAAPPLSPGDGGRQLIAPRGPTPPPRLSTAAAADGRRRQAPACRAEGGSGPQSAAAARPGSPVGAPTCHTDAAADDKAAAGGPAEPPRSPSRLSRRRECELLNAVETALGDAIWDKFPLYLRGIGITVHMGRSVEETRELMGRHLRDNGGPPHRDPPWEIVRSPLGGRGVVATRDLQPDDLVLVDPPLMLGPRAGTDPATPVVCVGCLRPCAPAELRACPRGCRLPVCVRPRSPACEDGACHAGECGLLRRWGVRGDAGQWSDALLRAAAAVRCLALPPEQRQILASMQSHHGRQHAFEVGLLLESLEASPSPEEERFMRLACCVMDANAFRMTLPAAEDGDGDGGAAGRQRADAETWGPLVGALRGLYPLGALLNHECTPNTRHSYDSRGRMVIRAARAVARGEELTVTYSALLWGSPARRQHLLRTKHFLCACARCKDPTEGGTLLAALPCPARPCAGPVLPASPLSLTGPWRCSGCGLHVPADRATLLQSVLGGLLRTLHRDPALPPAPDAVLRFLEDNRRLLPATNHITVELKADVVWALGRKPGLEFAGLTAEQLQLKESLIRELLAVLQALRAGRCSLSGMLLYELHCTLLERCRRDPGLWPSVAAEALESIEVAHGILGEDNAAPHDLAVLVRRARQRRASASDHPGEASPRPPPASSPASRPRRDSAADVTGGPPSAAPAPPEAIACL